MEQGRVSGSGFLEGSSISLLIELLNATLWGWASSWPSGMRPPSPGHLPLAMSRAPALDPNPGEEGTQLVLETTVSADPFSSLFPVGPKVAPGSWWGSHKRRMGPQDQQPSMYPAHCSPSHPTNL